VTPTSPPAPAPTFPNASNRGKLPASPVATATPAPGRAGIPHSSPPRFGVNGQHTARGPLPVVDLPDREPPRGRRAQHRLGNRNERGRRIPCGHLSTNSAAPMSGLRRTAGDRGSGDRRVVTPLVSRYGRDAEPRPASLSRTPPVPGTGGRRACSPTNGPGPSFAPARFREVPRRLARRQRIRARAPPWVVNDRIVWRTLVALNGSLFEHMCGAMRAVGGITAGRRVCRDGSAVQTAPNNSIKPGHLPRPTTRLRVRKERPGDPKEGGLHVPGCCIAGTARRRHHHWQRRPGHPVQQWPHHEGQHRDDNHRARAGNGDLPRHPATDIVAGMSVSRPTRMSPCSGHPWPSDGPRIPRRAPAR